MKFIDLENGCVFDVDSSTSTSESPYVFWFENGQSININYVQKICVLSNQPSLKISIDSPIFSLIDVDELVKAHSSNSSNTDIVNINDVEYKDLHYKDSNDVEKFVVDSLTLTYDQTPDCVYQYNENYIYILYFLALSHDTGEFIDDFIISYTENEDTINEVYRIGADFYPINEIFQSNMENFEITLPESIQRALFDVNIKEEANDNIVLNRKYKELLMNYWDIVANKGSYNSLINSLKWFEWGDLVRIEEAWREQEPHKEWLRLREVNSFLSPYMMEQLRHISKSTYMGLYYALDHIKRDEDGHVIYVDDSSGSDNYDFIDEQIPMIEELDEVTMKWTLRDTCLKMTLLGSFYSTFFMPVHLDLIHSTVENIVFTNTVKLLNNTTWLRNDTINLINPIELNYVYE